MRIKSIKYGQFEREPEEWKLDRCTFDQINLLVGKNASGKSFTLNIIKGLAIILSKQKKLPFTSGNYEVHFDNKGEEIVYFLKYGKRQVIKERLKIGSKTLLDRSSTGKGTIFASQLKKPIKFQTPRDEIAALARRDSIQHPFLEHLYNWGINLMHFYFGGQLGKDSYFLPTGKGTKTEIDFIDTNQVVAVFKNGQEKFSNKFTTAIKKDMSLVGFQIDNIEIDIQRGIIFPDTLILPSPPLGLVAKEPDLKGKTDQQYMAQGMFRTLSLIIQINYAQMARVPSCILVDDIGEGLDYERSTNLIKLLIEKAKNSDVQLIMATNDRFVMNNVPLKYWSVIRRIGNGSRIYNYRNARKIFDKFEFTGLSNFDFFSSDYFLGG